MINDRLVWFLESIFTHHWGQKWLLENKKHKGSSCVFWIFCSRGILEWRTCAVYLFKHRKSIWHHLEMLNIREFLMIGRWNKVMQPLQQSSTFVMQMISFLNICKQLDMCDALLLITACHGHKVKYNKKTCQCVVRNGFKRLTASSKKAYRAFLENFIKWYKYWFRIKG